MFSQYGSDKHVSSLKYFNRDSPDGFVTARIQHAAIHKFWYIMHCIVEVVRVEQAENGLHIHVSGNY